MIGISYLINEVMLRRRPVRISVSFHGKRAHSWSNLKIHMQHAANGCPSAEPRADMISQPAKPPKSHVVIAASDHGSKRGDSHSRNGRNQMQSQRARNTRNSKEGFCSFCFVYDIPAPQNLKGFDCFQVHCANLLPVKGLRF
jgi:hypothetical protein